MGLSAAWAVGRPRGQDQGGAPGCSSGGSHRGYGEWLQGAWVGGDGWPTAQAPDLGSQALNPGEVTQVTLPHRASFCQIRFSAASRERGL